MGDTRGTAGEQGLSAPAVYWPHLGIFTELPPINSQGRSPGIRLSEAPWVILTHSRDPEPPPERGASFSPGLEVTQLCFLCPLLTYYWHVMPLPTFTVNTASFRVGCLQEEPVHFVIALPH